MHSESGNARLHLRWWLVWMAQSFYWYVVFQTGRIVFILWNWNTDEKITISEWLAALGAGWKLDMAMAAYLSIVPLIWNTFLPVKANSWSHKILSGYYLAITLLLAAVCSGNLWVYKDWGSPINARAVSNLLNPEQMVASLSGWELGLTVLVVVVSGLLFWRIYLKMIHWRWPEFQSIPKLRWVWFIPLVFLSITGIRGGWGTLPIQEAEVFKFRKTLLNHTATNVWWALGHSLEMAGKADQIRLLPDSTTQNIFQTYRQSRFQCPPILPELDLKDSLQKLNIVLVLMESFSADFLAGDSAKLVVPFLSDLVDKGVLFNQLYSSGARTDQGLISIFSGFPAQPNQSVVRYPDKNNRLNSLFRAASAQGYHTSFYYGGDLNFANFNTYLTQHGVVEIFNEDDPLPGGRKGKWGWHDAYTLAHFGKAITRFKPPIFATVLTLDNHPPFDFDDNTPFSIKKSEQEAYKAGAWYTDKCIKNWMNSLQQWKEYPQTVFLFLADHGHRIPGNRVYDDPESRRTFAFLYSPLINEKWRGKQINTIGNQEDLVLMIQHWLGDKSTISPYALPIGPSDCAEGRAYLCLDDGLIWLTPRGHLRLYLDGRSPVKYPGPGQKITQEDELRAKAWMQQVFNDLEAL